MTAHNEAALFFPDIVVGSEEQSGWFLVERDEVIAFHYLFLTKRGQHLLGEERRGRLCFSLGHRPVFRHNKHIVVHA